MPSSEDYLDDLLNSINQAKENSDSYDRTERNRRDERSRRRRSVGADDDFLEANGLGDYIPRRIGRDNLRRALSEEEILRGFEAELESGDADRFIDEFERELELDELREDGGGAWDISEIGNDGGGGSRRTETVVTETPVEEDDYFRDPAAEAAASGDFGAASDDAGAAPAGHIYADDDTSLAAEVSRETGSDIDLSVENIPIETAGNPDDNLMQNIENILNDAKQETADAELSGEDLLGAEFAPDELDMSMLNPDGSAMEVPLLDESGDDVDLMAALAGGDGELMDIGDLLSADENQSELGEAREAFEASAESVLDGGDSLADASFEGESVEEEKEGGGFLGKIISTIKNLTKRKPKSDDEGDGADDAGGASTGIPGDDGFLELGDSNPTAEELSQESADILAGFSDENGIPGDIPEEDDGGGKKGKKEKKEKKKKEKKEKKPKEPKPKKEKKEKPVDNSPKIPLKAIIGFLLFAVSIVILVKVLQGIYANWLQIGGAQRAYDNGNYLSAYTALNGVDIDPDDEEDWLLLERSRLLAPMQMKYREYEVAMENKDYEKALDSVIIGSMYYRQNLSAAEELGVTEQYNILGAKLEQQMYDQFGISENEAIELFRTKKREDYTIELKHILETLGMQNGE